MRSCIFAARYPDKFPARIPQTLNFAAHLGDLSHIFGRPSKHKDHGWALDLASGADFPHNFNCVSIRLRARGSRWFWRGFPGVQGGPFPLTSYPLARMI
jgi:hypothetical protein